MSKLVTGGSATISAEQLVDLICEIENLKKCLEETRNEAAVLREALSDITPFAEAANLWMDSDYGYYRDKFEIWKSEHVDDQSDIGDEALGA